MNYKISTEKTVFWRDPHLRDLEMLQATYITHAFTRHTHDEFGIGVIEGGAEAFDYGHARHVAPAGSVVIVNPGDVHTGQAATSVGWSYRMFYPAASLLEQAASQLTDRPRALPLFSQAVIQDDEMAQRISNLHRTLESTGDPLERESRLLTLLTGLIERYATDRPQPITVGTEDRAVGRVREYLTAHYDQSITLEQLSKVAGLSQFHLLRVFRNHTGLPPHLYLTRLRINRAKRLLRQGRSIAQVALETGFVDQSHLTHQFKRTVGVTPGQYNSKIIQDFR